MEEIDAVGDAVFDEHAAGVELDQAHGGAAQSIDEQQGGLFMTEVGDDGDLPYRPLVVIEGDALIEDFRESILARDVVEFDFAPGAFVFSQALDDLLGASS